MTYRGKVKNGVVVLEQASALADGTEVTVEPLSSASQRPPTEAPSASQVMMEFAGCMRGSDLPTDGAENHDHYIYGAPKR